MLNEFAPDVRHRDVVNKVIAEKGEIAMASALLLEVSKDERERAHYRSRRMFETDKFHNEAVIKELAEKIGEERGIKRGENKKALEVARKMKKAGMPTVEIIEFTDLTIAEVEKV